MAKDQKAPGRVLTEQGLGVLKLLALACEVGDVCLWLETLPHSEEENRCWGTAMNSGRGTASGLGAGCMGTAFNLL